VSVPDDQRLEQAEGLTAPLKCLNHARFGVAFGVLGAAQFCLEEAVKYARARQQFGSAIGGKQLIQERLADMAEQIVVAANTSLRFGRLKEAKKLHPAQMSLLKRNNCRMALEVARSARAVLGANGILGEHHVMRHAANLESPYTYEGSHEIHTLILGATLTGLKAF
jgi:glutaryl-CoA dehydrogenase